MKDKQEQPALAMVVAPVGPYNSPDEISQWIRELESMPQIPCVPEALEVARGWLHTALESNGQGRSGR